MEGVWRIATPTGTFFARPPREAAISALAERQHRVVSVRQFEALWLGGSGVRNRISAGLLHREHRGVYRVGPGPLSARGIWMAAVLACGEGAVLSHRTAAALWELLGTANERVDVSIPRTCGRSRPALAVHRTETLLPQDITAVDGIPCTSVARTLLDLAEVVPRRRLERALEQAEVLGVFDGRAVADVLERANGRRGAGRLRAVLTAAVEPSSTASELEERFLALCRRAGIPHPAVNAWVATNEEHLKVDFLWRAERLVIEADGYAFHGNRRAFERDRRRDQLLKLAGFETVRFTWQQLADDPETVAEALQALLPSRFDPV